MEQVHRQQHTSNKELNILVFTFFAEYFLIHVSLSSCVILFMLN
jgi:hypothetical protein